MRILRFVPFALVFTVFSPGLAAACPTQGGNDTVFRPVVSRAESLIQAARELDAEGSRNDLQARVFTQTARKHRALAASLREQARLFPDLDTHALMTRAARADRDAMTAEAEANRAASRAAALHARADELRLLARQTMVSTRGQFL